MQAFIELLQSEILAQPFVQLSVVVLYAIGALFIIFYSIGQFHLLFVFLKNRKTYSIKAPLLDEADLPIVTVQLPMYNEMYVAEYVIDACAKLDYPSDKLEIQVLDDSTDETTEIANARAAFWQEKGIDVVVIHRENRDGFKAGALQEGTEIAKGDLIAIFDADFRPNPDFLKLSVGYFQDEEVGVFQGRWGHLNREYSIITRAQSLLHDAFFMIEQQARSIKGYLLRFNGSAGIWRKSTIFDAGGWSGDTLSEDYDLCLRAQMKGWRIVYDNEIVAPAELPVTMVDFKLQQYRWTKGRGQIIKKHTWNLIKADLPFMVKVHALFDLLNVFIHVGILLLAVFSIPLMFIIMMTSEYHSFLKLFGLALVNILLAPWFSWLVFSKYHDTFSAKMKEMLKTFPPFVLILIAFPFFATVSLFDGFLNKKSFFHRTSKYNAISAKESWKDKHYRPQEIPIMTWFEGIWAIIFLFGLMIDLSTKNIGFLPFHLSLTLGYSSLFYYSIRKA